MRNLLLLTLNTLKITFRKKTNIIVYLFLPVAVILFTMVMYSSGNSVLNIGVCNKSPENILAKDLVESIKSQKKYKVEIIKESEIKDKIASKELDCAISIPENFDEEILKHDFQKLTISSIKGADATGFIQNYLNYYVKNLMSLSLASNGDKDTFNKLYEGFKNSNLKVNAIELKDTSSEKSVSFYSIGIIIMFMMQGATLVSGFILKEKKQRTYLRIFSTPVNTRIYIGANILAGMCIMFLQSVIVVFASKYLFNLDSGVPEIYLILILCILGFACVTLGILFVAFSSTSSQASTMATLVITPTCMISGCFWPKELMPKYMQKLADFLPQNWALEAIKQLQNGKSLFEVIPYLGIVIGFALVFFLIAMYKMKSNEDAKIFI